MSWLRSLLHPLLEEFPTIEVQASSLVRTEPLPLRPRPKGGGRWEAEIGGGLFEGEVSLLRQRRVVERRMAQIGRLSYRLRRASVALADDLARLRELGG
jgi:hypothetical protein